MKSVFPIFLSVFFFAMSVLGQTPQELALEYLKLSKTRESFDSTIETYVNQAMLKNPKGDREKISKQFNDLMGWHILKNRTVELILKAFSIEEIKYINGFLKTKVGKKYADKSPWLASEISKLIISNLNNKKKDSDSLNDQLIQMANETNKQLPMVIDAHTRLDSTVGVDGEFTYKYTLLSLSSEEITGKKLKDAMFSNLLNAYCTSKDLKFFRDNKVVLNYSYWGKNGKQIIVLSISHDQCI